MTRVNVEAADALVSVLHGWADMTPETIRSIYPAWDPKPESYQEDLERFIRAEAKRVAEKTHPEGLEIMKAAMRWLLRDAPDFAEDLYNASLCELAQPPEPLVKLWQWAWEGVFGDEPWDIPGEEFELYSDNREVAYATLQGWDKRPPQDPRPFKWSSMP
jgi:hypothetical protein